MKSALIIALAGSAAAAPSLSDFFDSLFGGSDNDNSPSPTGLPNFPPVGTGSGLPFPFPIPSATGSPFPFPSSGAPPFPGSDSQQKRSAGKALNIDYQLAPAAAKVKARALKYRQFGTGTGLPSFSLLDPADTPTATGLPTALPTDISGLPTELPSGGLSLPTELPSGFPGLPTALPTEFPGLPTALPSGGFSLPFPIPTLAAAYPTAPAGTGLPGLPTTLETLTRGPQPTAAPEEPSSGEETENGNDWLSWIGELLSGGGSE